MNNEKPEQRPFLSVSETAELLGVHHATVRGAIRTGTIASLRVGKRILVIRAKLFGPDVVESPG